MIKENNFFQKKMNVLHHLMTTGSITDAEAWKKYAVKRIDTIIDALIDNGAKITREGDPPAPWYPGVDQKREPSCTYFF